MKKNVIGHLKPYLFTQIEGRKRFSGFNHQEELQGLVHNPAFLQVGGDLDGYNGFYQHVSSLHALVYPNNTQVFRNFLVSYRLCQKILFFLNRFFSLPAVSIAIIPFLMFFSGFIVSLVNKIISEMLGLKLSMILGCLAGLGGSIWILAGHTDSNAFKTYEIYAVAIIIGKNQHKFLYVPYCFLLDSKIVFSRCC